MFVRFRDAGRRLQVSLVETRRADGKVRHEHIASLGSIVMPTTVLSRHQAEVMHILRSLNAREYAFVDTNRHLVEVPDSFAVARWSRYADVPTTARCILATLRYEPHTTDTSLLRRALEGVIEHTARGGTAQKQQENTNG